MDTANVSVRGLAKRIGNGDPQMQEQARRSLYKWLAGDHLPSEMSRETVALALDLPGDAYTQTEEEDEEDAALAVELFGIVKRISERHRDEVQA